MSHYRHSMPPRPYSENTGFYVPPETDPKNAALNLIKLKGQARKLGRTDSSGTSVWNPFRIIDHDANAKVNRRSTAGDVEAGLGPRDADFEEMSPITQRSTAPERLSTPLPDDKGNTHANALQGSPRQVQFDSPSSAQPGANDANGNVMRNRKPTSAGDSSNAADGGELERKKSKEEKKHALFKHVHPKEPFTVANQLQRTVLNSWINILLLAVPAGFAVNYAGLDGRVIFTVNFVAIIPLAAMLGFATEEIALRTGETLGGLINATFGNAVELIVAIIALLKDEIVVVQTSLIGSILSNLLLVLGMCFFFGGFNRPKQSFNQVVAQTAASLLALAVASNIIPTIFKNNVDNPNTTDVVEGEGKIAAISRGVSVILLFVYCCYLYFQLKTHAEIFNETSEKTATYNASAKSVAAPGVGGAITGAALVAAKATQGDMKDESGTARLVKANNGEEEEDEDEEEDPQLHFWVAVATLTAVTVLIAFCAEFMVDGISAITNDGHVSEEFVGLILLPIVGNAAEHATAVTVAVKDKMDLAIGVAVGSSMQVSLFLIPLLVIIGWGMGLDDMNLAFDTFQIVVLFVSVLLVNYLIGDGESHWLEGVLLICLYIIIAVCAWCKSLTPRYR